MDSRKPKKEKGYLSGILKNDIFTKKLDVTKRLMQDVDCFNILG